MGLALQGTTPRPRLGYLRDFSFRAAAIALRRPWNTLLAAACFASVSGENSKGGASPTTPIVTRTEPSKESLIGDRLEIFTKGLSLTNQIVLAKEVAEEIENLPALEQRLRMAWHFANESPPATLSIAAKVLEKALLEKCDPADATVLELRRVGLDALAAYEHYSGVTTTLRTEEYTGRLRILEETARKRKAADFTLNDLAGKQVTLSALRGKVVLVNFFATWCGPCCAEMPHLKAIAESPQNNGDVVVLTVAVQSDDPAKLRRFVKDRAIGFPVLYDGEGVAARNFFVDALPLTFVYNDAGELIEQLRGGQTPEQLAESLKRAGWPKKQKE